MKIRYLLLILLALSILFLVGCQKYGLAVEFPKNYSIKSDLMCKADQPEGFSIPSTKALVLKDGKLDLSLADHKDFQFKFDKFNLDVIAGTFNEKPFQRFVIFEPKDANNDFSVVMELNTDGQIMREVIIQKRDGKIIEKKEFIFER